MKLRAGDFILAVNGVELKTPDNYWKLFNLVPGRKFEFTVNDKPDFDGAWTVLLDPLSGAALADLQYQQWVTERKEMVDKLSGGQIGYLHIRAMDARFAGKIPARSDRQPRQKSPDHRRAFQRRRRDRSGTAGNSQPAQKI